MKVLLHSCAFYPSTGGVETISRTMAKEMSSLGNEIVVVTETPLGSSDEIVDCFRIQRSPSLSQRIKLTKSADIVFSNGASMGMFFFAKALGKPFVWTHNGYQVSCIDGLGWVDGEPSPLGFWKSVRYHCKGKGFAYALKEGMKLALRRGVASLVDRNIAATQWVAHRQTLPNQVQIYTPYDLEMFQNWGENNEVFDYDFVFVGRLVSEKGVRTLLVAFAQVSQNRPDYCGRLLIVGDGPERIHLERLAQELGISKQTDLVGRKTGPELVQFIHKAPIAIVPSEWEEPMGGVALELLAAGRTLIVSKRGGMAECMGAAALTFENGDASDLSRRMEMLVFDPQLRERLRNAAPQQLNAFDPRMLTARYLAEFERILNLR